MTAHKNTKILIKMGALAAFFLFIITYAYIELKDVVRGPELEISTPLNGSTTNTSLVNIHGKASHISFIHLNDRKIFTDEFGSFSEQLLLYPGYNIITITAEDRFARSITKKVEIVYKDNFNDSKTINTEQNNNFQL